MVIRYSTFEHQASPRRRLKKKNKSSARSVSHFELLKNNGHNYENSRQLSSVSFLNRKKISDFFAFKMDDGPEERRLTKVKTKTPRNTAKFLPRPTATKIWDFKSEFQQLAALSGNGEYGGLVLIIS